MQRTVVLILTAMLFACATPVRADLTLTVPSATFNIGDGIDVVDVLITGDGGNPFGKFTLNFSITPDPSNATAPGETISFVAPPSDPSVDPTLNNPNYVFFGNSLDQLLSSGFGNVSGTPPTSLSVGDSTADFSDVTLASGQMALMAELRFVVPNTVTNPGGDKFDVTLQNPSTALQSNNGAPNATVDASTGIITLQQGAAPEPGTLGMLLVGMTGLLWSRRRRT